MPQLDEYDQQTLSYLAACGTSNALLRRVQGSMERTDRGLWVCVVQVSGVTVQGWGISRQLPTFLLDEQIQGAMTEEAARNVATQMVRSIDREGTWTEINVSVKHI